MDKKPCPICTRLNEPQETHCWFCHAELPPVSVEQQPSSDWLNGLRQDQDAASENISEFPAEPAAADVIEKPEEHVPDWLSRIRSKEATERAEKKAQEDKYWAEKQSHSGVPDWLHSLNEDIADADTNKKDEPAAPGLNIVSAASPIEEHSITSAGGDDWLESLNSWQPVDGTESSIQPENPEVTGSPTEIEIPPQPELQEPTEFLPAPEFDLDKIFSPLIEEPEKEPEKPAETPELVLPEGFQPFEITFDETEAQKTFSQPEEVLPDLSSPVDNLPQGDPEIESVSTISDESLDNAPSEVDLTIIQDSINNDSAAQAQDSAEFIYPEDQIEVTQPLDQSGLDILTDQIEGKQPQSDIQVEHEEIVEGVSADEVSAETHIDPFKADDILLEPFAPDDLPEWLTDVKPIENKSLKEKSRSATSPVDDGSPKPEKGNLPVWLAAQRPVEAVEMAAIPEEKPQLS